jgi:cytidine deaminase
MEKKQSGFEFEVYGSIEELDPQDAALLKQARSITADAYAPYSGFHVSAVALLQDGQIFKGTNLENASYPAGICAEQALLGAVNSSAPGVGIQTIAISYNGEKVNSDHPISPCGICRQALTEFELRAGKNIRLILGGIEGEVYVIPSARSLLPLAFTPSELG